MCRVRDLGGRVHKSAFADQVLVFNGGLCPLGLEHRAQGVGVSICATSTAGFRVGFSSQNAGPRVPGDGSQVCYSRTVLECL